MGSHQFQFNPLNYSVFLQHCSWLSVALINQSSKCLRAAERGFWFSLQFLFTWALHQFPSCWKKMVHAFYRGQAPCLKMAITCMTFMFQSSLCGQAGARSSWEPGTCLAAFPAHPASCISSFLRALPISESHSSYHCLRCCFGGSHLRQIVKKFWSAISLSFV